MHHERIISTLSAHHRHIISASPVHHQRIISASSAHHQCIISASQDHTRPDQIRSYQTRPDQRRLPSRGPNSKTCVLVASATLTCTEHSLCYHSLLLVGLLLKSDLVSRPHLLLLASSALPALAKLSPQLESKDGQQTSLDPTLFNLQIILLIFACSIVHKRTEETSPDDILGCKHICTCRPYVMSFIQTGPIQ